MFKDIAKEMANNDIYGIISLVIFAVVFAAVIVYVITMRREKIEKLKNLPFEGEEKTSQEKEQELRSSNQNNSKS